MPAPATADHEPEAEADVELKAEAEAISVPEPVAEVVDLPWEEPAVAPAPLAAEPAPEPAPAPEPVAPVAPTQAAPAHDEPPFDPSAYAAVGMERDDEPPLDEDYYGGESDPAGFSYLDELAEHVQEDVSKPAAEPLPAPNRPPAWPCNGWNYSHSCLCPG